MNWLSSLWAGIRAFFARLFGTNSAQPSNIPTPPAAAGGWTFQFSPGMDGPTPATFTFPSTNGVHNLVQGYSGALRTGLHLRARIDAAGGTQFSADTGTAATGGTPMVTLYFQQRGDDFTATFPDRRWWFSTRATLQNGELTIDAPLADPAMWTQVFGKPGSQELAGFQSACADVQAVGMTFGGDYYGHGVFVPQGSATFTIIEWIAS